MKIKYGERELRKDCRQYFVIVKIVKRPEGLAAKIFELLITHCHEDHLYLKLQGNAFACGSQFHGEMLYLYDCARR